MKVVTYMSSSSTINICQDCEQRFREQNEWPRDRSGEEFATVSHGLHQGTCDTCEACQDDS